MNNDPSYVISILASISTCITALIGLLTIFEMKRQREEMHKPILNICHFIHIDVIEKNGVILFNGNTLFSEKISISNIGNGSAQNIYIKYKINYEKIINILKQLCTNQMIQMIGEKDIEFKSNDKRFYLSFLSSINTDDEFYSFDFIKQNTEVLELEFPLIINRLFSILLYLVREKISVTNDWNYIRKIEYKKIPLKIIITYEDVGGKKYTKVITIGLSFNFCVYELKDNLRWENILNTKISLN